MKKLTKGKGLLGMVLTALLLCALVVPAAMPTPVLAAEGEWTQMTSPTTEDFQAVWGSSSSNFIAVATNGTIVHYDGTSWSLMTSPTTQKLYHVWGSSSSDVFVVGSNGTIIHYDGTNWSTMTEPTNDKLWAIWGSSGSDVFVVGYNVAAGNAGVVLHYDGTNWSTMTEPTNDKLWAIWGSSSSDVFAVGKNGNIIHYDGTSWSTMTSPTTYSLFGVWGSSGSDVFAVGSSGTISHYDGTSWSTMTSPTTNTLLGIWGSSSSDVFVVGSNGTIIHYDGTSWSTMTCPPDRLMGVWGSSGSDVFAVGKSGTILHYGPPAVSVDLRATGSGPTDIINVTGYSVPFGDVTEDGVTVDRQTAMGALVCYCQDNAINVEVIDTGWGPYVSQVGGNPADANTWMYALNESFPWIPADQQPVVNGDSLHWCNYTLGLYSLSLSLDKTEIAPGEDITATVTWTDGEGVTSLAENAEVYVSDTTDTFGNPVPPGTPVGSTNASGELTFIWSTEGRFWPYAEFNGKSSIGQWPVPTFTCNPIAYGKTVVDSWKTWRPERALGEPDSIGAKINSKGDIIIQLSDTITDATKVTVTVAKGRGKWEPSFGVSVSADGETWIPIGTYTCAARGYITYEFNEDFGEDFGDVEFIKVERPKECGQQLYLDAVCAEHIWL